MDPKKFIKTSPEWHDLLDFIGKDWQFDCPSGQHVPYGISPKTLGGDFIQEGADNIDLNTETIDGKNTMHYNSSS
jgi:hypothetical protein